MTSNVIPNQNHSSQAEPYIPEFSPALSVSPKSNNSYLAPPRTIPPPFLPILPSPMPFGATTSIGSNYFRFLPPSSLLPLLNFPLNRNDYPLPTENTRSRELLYVSTNRTSRGRKAKNQISKEDNSDSISSNSSIDDSTLLFVRKIPFEMNKEKLVREYFSKFGNIVHVEV